MSIVYEEKYVKKYDVSPLKVSGFEGLFGVTTLGILFIPFYFIYVGPKFGQNPRMVIEDASDGFYQLSKNPTLCSIMVGKMVLIAIYNFACVSITKEMSATTRVIINAARTMIIWSVSLVLGWQEFHGLQVFGLIILCSGIFIYNDVLFGMKLYCLKMFSLIIASCSFSSNWSENT